MRNRGKIYWDWADSAIHCRNHDERLSSGILLNVQVRLSAERETQMFLGVYERGGAMVREESFDCRSDETMSQALSFGIARAREIANSHAISNKTK